MERGVAKWLIPVLHSCALLLIVSVNAVVAIAANSVWLWFTIPLAGFGMACGLSAIHECAHATYLPVKPWNKWVGRFWSLLILMSFSQYRHDHMLHHAHFGTDKDSEGQAHIKSLPQLLIAVLYNRHALEHWARTARSLTMKNRKQGDAQFWDAASLGVLSIILLSVTAAYPVLLLVYWLPLAISLVFDNLISLPEHTLFFSKKPDRTKTRSYSLGEPLNFFMYYVNFHQEHHAKPKQSAINRPYLRISNV